MDNILNKLNLQVEKTVLSGNALGSSLLKLNNKLLKGGFKKQTGGKLVKKSKSIKKHKTLVNRKHKTKTLPKKTTRKTKNKKRIVNYSKYKA